MGTIQSSPERLLGFIFHVGSDQNKAKHIRHHGPNKELYPNFVIDHVNQHHLITYRCITMPFPLVARDFLQRAIFTQVDDDKFVLVFEPIDRKTEATKIPPYTASTLKLGEKRIRGEATILCIFERLPNNCCKFTYIVKADIKGSVPKVVAESGLHKQVDLVRQTYQYFDRDEEVRANNRERVSKVASLENSNTS